MPLLTCTGCGKQQRKRVAYGYPEQELIEQAQRGEVVLGGCCPGVPVAGWLCDDCAEHATDLDWFECSVKQLAATEEFERETLRQREGASDSPTRGTGNRSQ
jgi:hypothetical protein